MKNIKYIIGLFLSLTLVFSGCEKVDKEFGDIVAPSNIQLTAEIVGQDATNPYGDGSGTVTFTASAQNVITYKFVYDGVENMSPTGTKTYNFGKTGIFKYTVTAVAIGTAGVTSSASIEVEVLALYAPPADLLTMLTADDTRTWRIKAEAGGHFGVGPVDADSPIWWGANPYDKDGLGAYDDRIVFNVDGTLTYITNGDIYGKADPLSADFDGDQGLTPNGDAEFVNYPAVDFTDSWSLSAPGGVETLTFASKGFHGFYVGGDHSYVILSRSANEMSLRTVGADGLGWFGILIAD
jgi:hypothetical protein